MNGCCGTCEYHVPGEIPGESDWICDNAEAEEYALETEYSYCCEMYEERKR